MCFVHLASQPDWQSHRQLATLMASGRTFVAPCCPRADFRCVLDRTCSDSVLARRAVRSRENLEVPAQPGLAAACALTALPVSPATTPRASGGLVAGSLASTPTPRASGGLGVVSGDRHGWFPVRAGATPRCFGRAAFASFHSSRCTSLRLAGSARLRSERSWWS